MHDNILDMLINPNTIPQGFCKIGQNEKFGEYEGRIDYTVFPDIEGFRKLPTADCPEVSGLVNKEDLIALCRDNGIKELSALGDSIKGKFAKRFLEVSELGEGQKLLSILGTVLVEGYQNLVRPFSWIKIDTPKLLEGMKSGSAIETIEKIIGRLLGTANEGLKKAFHDTLKTLPNS